jgi:hypothetical protein
MAEREGFEPSVSLLDLHAISSRAPSAARASLRIKQDFGFFLRFLLSVIYHALKINHDNGFVTHDPGIVPGGQ